MTEETKTEENLNTLPIFKKAEKEIEVKGFGKFKITEFEIQEQIELWDLMEKEGENKRGLLMVWKTLQQTYPEVTLDYIKKIPSSIFLKLSNHITTLNMTGGDAEKK